MAPKLTVGLTGASRRNPPSWTENYGADRLRGRGVRSAGGRLILVQVLIAGAVVVLGVSIGGGGLERSRGLVDAPVEESDQRLIDADHLAAALTAQRLAHDSTYARCSSRDTAENVDRVRRNELGDQPRDQWANYGWTRTKLGNPTPAMLFRDFYPATRHMSRLDKTKLT